MARKLESDLNKDIDEDDDEDEQFIDDDGFSSLTSSMDGHQMIQLMSQHQDHEHPIDMRAAQQQSGGNSSRSRK